MTQDHPSKLSFSIEESVWLNKGQEISEVLSMSLDPDITIEESADHVFIRGGLQLKGEYRPKTEQEMANQERDDSRDDLHFRSIEEISLSDEGIGEIKHYFPIDVTIPLNRINNLEDVYVEVETFDYDLPERSCIQLTADVTISGMSTAQERTPEPKQEKLEQAQVPTAPPVEPEAFQPFRFEAKKQPEPVMKEENTVKMEQPVPEVPLTVEQKEVAELIEETDVKAEVTEEPEREPIEEAVVSKSEAVVEAKPEPKVQTNIQAKVEQKQEEKTLQAVAAGGSPRFEGEEIGTTIEKTVDKPIAPMVTEPKLEEEPVPQVVAAPRAERTKEEEPVLQSYEEPLVEEVEEKETETPENRDEKASSSGLSTLKGIANNQMPEIAFSASEPEEELEPDREEDGEESDRPSMKNENALYLTKMLTNGEEEFSKLRMCIIQENESLDMIAERYEVQASHLVRINKLESEQIEQGQILYIPIVRAKKEK
ncbi:stage VI sporulation protein D [Alkalihalobacillus sp. LMS39]|uniref:stage VI sporulation protein D n=1 Tax=Alkalihalobacillus sp. LMS39 TaxID=2924032 RepID=UPI001FB4C38C|nr:stage VI sporulation protein D [Alkalihalobacillus sp. LMS39]UOE93335.1 stage VI sporulation protein D [Alkalihalobacillus sp. LMS39]